MSIKESGLSNASKHRAVFNKKLKKGELEDLINVANRVKVLMNKDNGFDFKVASKQSMKDIKKVNVDNLENLMYNIYPDEYWKTGVRY